MRPVFKITACLHRPNREEHVWYAEIGHAFTRTWLQLNREDFHTIDFNRRLILRQVDPFVRTGETFTIECVCLRMLSADDPPTWGLDCWGPYVDTYPNGCPKKFPGFTPIEEVIRVVRG